MMKVAELAVYGVIIVSALLVIGLVWVLPAVTSPQMQGRISIYATGVAYGIPQQSTVSLTVNGTGQSTQLAAGNLSSTMSELNSTIGRYVNNNWSLVNTQSYNVYKLYNKSGYVATELVSATLPNIDNSSSFLGALSRIPSVYVTGIQSALSQSQVSVLRSQALQNAVENATAQARTIAGNSTVLTVQNVTVTGGYNIYPYTGAGLNSAASALVSNPTFYSGRSKVVESITVEFSYRG